MKLLKNTRCTCFLTNTCTLIHTHVKVKFLHSCDFTQYIVPNTPVFKQHPTVNRWLTPHRLIAHTACWLHLCKVHWEQLLPTGDVPQSHQGHTAEEIVQRGQVQTQRKHTHTQCVFTCRENLHQSIELGCSARNWELGCSASSQFSNRLYDIWHSSYMIAVWLYISTKYSWSRSKPVCTGIF